MAIYADEKRAYGPEVGAMVEEPPLLQRLESIQQRLRHVLDVCTELQHGPQPEAGGPSGMTAPTPYGVLSLGADCEKLAGAVDNGIMMIAKRIGRL